MSQGWGVWGVFVSWQELVKIFVHRYVRFCSGVVPPLPLLLPGMGSGWAAALCQAVGTEIWEHMPPSTRSLYFCAYSSIPENKQVVFKSYFSCGKISILHWHFTLAIGDYEVIKLFASHISKSHEKLLVSNPFNVSHGNAEWEHVPWESFLFNSFFFF